MNSYTAHDAAVILVKKTLLKHLKKYKIDLDIYPIEETGIYDNGCFYILIHDNEWFPNIAFKVEIKREIISEINYLKCKEQIRNEKLLSYIVPINTKVVETNL